MFTNKNCVPCQGGILPLDTNQISKYNKLISDDWFVIDERKLVKNFVFNTFDKAVFFSNKVAQLATLEGHHPYIHINFKTVKINLFTHKIDGLHENDYLMAKKIDTLI